MKNFILFATGGIISMMLIKVFLREKAIQSVVKNTVNTVLQETDAIKDDEEFKKWHKRTFAGGNKKRRRKTKKKKNKRRRRTKKKSK